MEPQEFWLGVKWVKMTLRFSRTGSNSMGSMLVVAYVRIRAPSSACHVALYCPFVAGSFFLFVQT